MDIKEHINPDVKIGSFIIPYAIVDFVQSAAMALTICLVIYVFVAMPNQIEGDSMKPNFHNGEVILTSKLSQWLGEFEIGKLLGLEYKLGDIVVFQKPGYNDFVKRIIGMPGDKVELKNGQVYINGQKLIEDYLPEGTYTKGGDFIENGSGEKIVAPNRYFVLGDNRSDSHDSRYADIAFIDRNWMKGKVVFKYWPIDALGTVQAGNYKLEGN